MSKVLVTSAPCESRHPSFANYPTVELTVLKEMTRLPYTIIAPNLFMEVWIAAVVGMPAMRGEPVTVVGEGRRKHSFISARDVAAFITAAADNPAALNQKLLLGGPEPLSFRDAAIIYGLVLRQGGPDPILRRLRPGK